MEASLNVQVEGLEAALVRRLAQQQLAKKLAQQLAKKDKELAQQQLGKKLAQQLAKKDQELAQQLAQNDQFHQWWQGPRHCALR